LALTISTDAQAGGVAFLERDYVSGMSRVCVYNYLGSPYIITLQAYELCPLSVHVP
jgi:hypothetical protein